MRFLYDNLIKYGEISATNSDTSFPISNVTHKFLMKKFQTLTGFTTSEITITLNDVSDINCIALGFHNAQAATYELRNSSSTLLSSGSLNTTYSTDMTHFATVSNVKTIIIDIDAGSSATEAYIGGISVGKSLVFELINQNPPMSLPSNDKSNQTEGGQVTGKKTKRLRGYQVPFDVISNSQYNEIQEHFNLNGSVYPVYLDIFEESHDFIQPLYCVVPGSESFTPIGLNKEWSGSLIAREAR